MPDRYLLWEDRIERSARGAVILYTVKKWVLHYSDGTVETLTVKTKQEHKK